MSRTKKRRLTILDEDIHTLRIVSFDSHLYYYYIENPGMKDSTPLAICHINVFDDDDVLVYFRTLINRVFECVLFNPSTAKITRVRLRHNIAPHTASLIFKNAYLSFELSVKYHPEIRRTILIKIPSMEYILLNGCYYNFIDTPKFLILADNRHRECLVVDAKTDSIKHFPYDLYYFLSKCWPDIYKSLKRSGAIYENAYYIMDKYRINSYGPREVNIHYRPERLYNYNFLNDKDFEEMARLIENYAEDQNLKWCNNGMLKLVGTNEYEIRHPELKY